jgi:hypothetical protein
VSLRTDTAQDHSPPASYVRTNGRDDRLAYIDQTSFLGLRALGMEQVVQWIWTYDRAVDLAGLARFHRNLDHGLFGRRIERSPLPFGRHRWVAAVGGSPLDVAEGTRPRSERSDWADQRAELPVDPEWGPGWHLGVQAFDDGSTAVSLVASHCLIDGLGGGLAMADAANGRLHDLGYPAPRSRSPRQAVADDILETARSVPDAVRAVGTLVRLARQGQQDLARLSGTPPAPTTGKTGVVVIPAITVQLDVDDWDARVDALGGTSNALFNAIAAKLGDRLGRRAVDGTVRVRFVVSDRSEHDTRGNAVSFVTIEVDPAQVTTELSTTRAAIKEALSKLVDSRDETVEVLPLTPYTPRWAVRRMAEAMFDDFSVGCSYLGDVDPASGSPDGTRADTFCMRGVTQHITHEVLERIRGQITLAAGRFGPKVFLTVVAYQVGANNTKPELRKVTAETLAEFGLTGAID